MCDTLIALPSVTKNQNCILVKNSDRPPNEAQHLLRIPAQVHESGAQVHCTYISIPQVKETIGILLSKPYWMWGAEMGVNQAGLAIGNEAIYSKIPANKEPALLGMDLLRLALERATKAREAVEVIIELLEQYGQGGNCVNQGEMYYHNSFLIADPQDAWVLETIDRDWVARKILDFHTISNVLTIREKYDMASTGIENTFKGQGNQIDLDRNYSDFLYTTFSNARNRCNSTWTQLNQGRGKVDVEKMIAILRDGNTHNDPGIGLTKSNVCMHAGFGPIRISQTTASLVAVLDDEKTVVFATGTAAPCTGIFKPLWVDSHLPDMGPIPTDTFDPSTLFWSHEMLHRSVERNFNERLDTYSKDRDKLEIEFIQSALELINAPLETRQEFSKTCFERASQAEKEWLQRVKSAPEEKTFPHLLHDFAWNKYDQQAQMKYE